MEASFPVSEIRPIEQIIKAYHEGLLKIELLDENRVKGFITYWDFQDFFFIEHFAIDPAYRNQGLGQDFFAQLLQKYAQPFVLEVEPPFEDIQKRRVGFYQRLGFHLLPYPYLQPPYQAGYRPLPMHLMSYPMALNQPDFELYRDRIYHEVYHTSAEELIP